MIGQISPKSSSQRPRVRNPRHHIQLALFVAALGVSLDESYIVARFVCLTLLIDSTIEFTIAFSLETLLFSSESWAKVPVGTALSVVILLILWCACTTFQVGTDLSVLDRVHVFKDHLVRFSGSLCGYASESRLDAGDAGDYGGQDTRGMLNRLRTLKEAFNRLRRRPRGTTLPLANPTGTNRGGLEAGDDSGSGV